MSAPDALTTNLEVKSSVTLSKNITGADPMKFNASTDDTLTETLGTGTGGSNAAFWDVRQLNGGASEILDLTALTVFGGGNPPSNYFGSLAFTKVKTILIKPITNADKTTQSSGVRVGGAGANEWSGWLSVGGTEDADAGGNPYNHGSDLGRVVDSSHKLLKILNLDGTNKLTYEILITGTQ